MVLRAYLYQVYIYNFKIHRSLRGWKCLQVPQYDKTPEAYVNK
jgi:hypothetical protein